MGRTAFGFKKYISTGSATTEAMRMAENYVKTHTDERGDVSDPQVYQNAIELMAPYSDDLKVANKIADFQNKTKDLEDKVLQSENNKVAFNQSFQRAKLDAIQQNYSDPRAMFYKLAEINGLALDEFDTSIISDAVDRSPNGANIPQDLLDYREELKKDTATMMDLFNSYNTVDETTELAGPSNPDSYGVFINTNPQTGAIVNLEVELVDSLSDAKKGFTQSNSRYGRIPIYLNTYTLEGEEVARLGPAKYNIDDDGKFLELENGLGIMDALERTFRAIGKETRKGVKQEQQEFPIGAVPFDYFTLPNENVVKDVKGDLYYYDKDNNLWKADSPETLKRYLRETGGDPNAVDNNVYLGHPDFINSRFTPDEEGNFRTLSADMFESAPVPVIPGGGGEVKAGVDFSALREDLLNRGGGNINQRASKIVPPAPEFTEGGGFSFKRISQKAKEIFSQDTSLGKSFIESKDKIFGNRRAPFSRFNP